MKIVGFQSGHDVSYCILDDGIPVVHEELERFTREKEPLGDGLKMFFERNENIDDIQYFAHGNFGGRSGRWTKQCGIPHYDRLMKDMVKKNSGAYYELGHHKSHASNAFFSSNFDKSLIVTMDAGGHEKRGQVSAFTIWQGEGNKILPLKIYPINDLCVGCSWHSVTAKVFGLSVGYPKGNQAGTVMAMATLGNPDIYFKDFYDKDLNVDFEHYRVIASKGEQFAFDVAAALQKATEEIVRRTLSPWIDSYSNENICFSGGVSLNCVMLGKIREWFPKIVNVYCDPVPYDGGLSLGAARYVWHHLLDNPRINWKSNSSAYLGRKYSSDDIAKSISARSNIECQKVTDDFIVSLVNDQKIVSLFGGGSESGRRALGNRSIIADPRNDKMKEIINEKVKHRQWYRPFAPSILREEVRNWFEQDIESPYMSFAIKFKDEVRDRVPAVVHFDGTGRLQTVTGKDNPWYYEFIKKWHEKSGVPILINTSFNDREPIVETPDHAIDCFLRTNIDYLYFRDDGLLISKRSSDEN